MTGVSCIYFQSREGLAIDLCWRFDTVLPLFSGHKKFELIYLILKIHATTTAATTIDWHTTSA